MIRHSVLSDKEIQEHYCITQSVTLLLEEHTFPSQEKQTTIPTFLSPHGSSVGWCTSLDFGIIIPVLILK